MRYNNYHKHTHYSNISTPDCIVKPVDYAKRALDLGHTTICTTEHGYAGNVFEYYDIAKEYDLKLIFGVEFYYVNDRFEKDRSNTHLMILAKNNQGKKELTRLISESNKTGYYYKPRIDKELVLNLDPKNVLVTSTCVMSYIGRNDDYEEQFIEPFLYHFKDNFFLEIHDNVHRMQVDYNKKILDLHNKYRIPLIHATDSHYIYPEQDKDRTEFLNGKNIYYPEEDGFILDYPDSDTIFKRYEEQGVFTKEQVKSALENTLLLDDFEDIVMDKEIKMPSIYPDLSHKEKMDKLKTILNEAWIEDRKEVPAERQREYIEAIRYETDIIEETMMEDYFLLNYEIIKKAKEKGGVLTRTGRGCFKGDALVHTLQGLKKIQDVIEGDYVINRFGKPDKVLTTFKYKINEEMIKLNHLYGTDKYFPVIATRDHKILIKRGCEIGYIQAQNVRKGDYVVTPKIKFENKSCNYIDLNTYNFDGFEYDDEFIYEPRIIGSEYDYSPSHVAAMVGCSTYTIERFIRGERVGARKPEILKNIFNSIPFSTQEEYAQYVLEKRNQTSKIPRYIKNDELLNKFIGLMYGDGVNSDNGKIEVGLAINTKNHKSVVNREVFYQIVERFNLTEHIYESNSKRRNLCQLYIKSKLFKNFVSGYMFKSNRGASKEFNTNLFYQSRENLKALYEGFILSDGHIGDRRVNFDSTSLSLINAVKLINLAVGDMPMSISYRKGKVDSRGHNNRDSYKLRKRINREGVKKSDAIHEDEHYWFLPITSTEVIPKHETYVYDLQVENDPSFLINNMIVHNSAPSFYVNKLLGFTEIDRLDAPITLYPTRFMSKSRILESRSLPDIDFNTADPHEFIEASKEILGDDNVYCMVAYGTMQESEAFRNYCRAKGFDMDEYNEIGKNLDLYKNDFKWGSVIEESKKFIGVIDSVSPHPCAFLLHSEPISDDIGVIRIGSGDDINYCCLIDSSTSDRWKYFKNDLLTVKVWKIISEGFKAINKPIPSIRELTRLVENDDKVWELYEKGLTATLNQAGTDSGTSQVVQYKPKSIRELSAWVAAIRPSFESMKYVFLNREPFEYGIPEFDSILRESDNFVLYQENIMATLVYAGFAEDETYGLLKAIAKKVPGIIEPIYDKFINGFVAKTGSRENAEKVWKIIEDAVGYGFNSSHAYAVALDSIYGAYLKANYPLQYYATVLNLYEDDIKITAKIISELPYLGIKIRPIKFGLSKSDYTPDISSNSIYKGISSIKYLNEKVSDELFTIGKNHYDDFVDLLVDIEENTSCNSRQMEILIKLNFFEDYGKNKKLLKIYSKFKKRYKKGHIDTTKKIRIAEIKYFSLKIPDEAISIQEQIVFEKEMLGYAQTVFPEVDEDYALVIDIDKKYTPRITFHRMKDGAELVHKIGKQDFYSGNSELLSVGDIVKILSVDDRKRKAKRDGKWIELDDTETWIKRLAVIRKYKKDVDKHSN